MSELIEKKPCDFSVFDEMNTEALEEILKADAQQLDDNTNLTAILYITELLDRRAISAGEYHFDSSKQKPNFATLLSLPTPENTSTILSVQENSIHTIHTTRKKDKRRFFRTGVFIAATISLLFILSGVASAAFGINIWSTLARWTDEVFSFSHVIDEQKNTSVVGNTTTDAMLNETSFHDLQSALNYYDVSALSAPTFVPSGYVIGGVFAENSPTGLFFNCDYFGPDEELITITYTEFLSEPAMIYEKTDNSPDSYVISDTVCYAFSNTNNNTVVWITDNFECSITGCISLDILREMVTSILSKG